MSDDLGITFVLEGQEESGLSLKARGFDRVLEDNRSMFENTCGVLISNNYWIDDKRPCLTYGMRGVIDLAVEVRGPISNLHSGVHGGAIHEASEDLVALLASLSGAQLDFLSSGVRALEPEHRRFYEKIGLDVARYQQQIGVGGLKNMAGGGGAILQSRWSQPSLSISNIRTSNATNAFRMIPSSATARISFHFVPDQDAKTLTAKLREHIENVFRGRESCNTLDVSICQVSDWWLGDTGSKIFKVAQRAIEQVWGVTPLYVREGGSYGGISSIVQNFCNAPVLHLPLGQATDSAHLPNERISVENLLKGKQVIEEIILNF
jgi:di- and tripeptidase